MEFDPDLFLATYAENLFLISPPPIIILDQPWEAIASTDKILLAKILNAVKQTLNAVTIKHQDSLDLSHWIEKPERIIYFGNPIKGIPLYDPVDAHGTVILASERLINLSQDDEARKKLWQALKKQFLI